MAGFDGAGTYVLRYSFVADAAANIKILASRQDQQWNDMATGFNNCLTRDGQGKPANNIDWNNHQITNMADGADAHSAATVGQVTDITARGGGGANPIVNPQFQIWQRPFTSAGPPAYIDVPAAGAYVADHWYLYRDGGTGSTRAYAIDGDVGNPFGTSVAISRVAGDTHTENMRFRQVIETVESEKITGFQNHDWGGSHAATVFSCYLKRGLNLPTTNIYLIIHSNATEDASPTNAGWVAEVTNVISSTLLDTVQYTRFDVSLQSDFTNTQSVMVEVVITDPSATAGADDSVSITACKIDQYASGDNDEPSPYAPNPYVIDFLRCQRYYTVLGGGAINSIQWAGACFGGQTMSHPITLPVPMLKAPSASKTGTFAVTGVMPGGSPAILTANNTVVHLRSNGNCSGAVAAFGSWNANDTAAAVVLLAECDH
jgi:hypothetical protein